MLNNKENLLPKLKTISIPNKKKNTNKKKKKDSYFLMFLNEYLKFPSSNF